jgi:hypothetical protein
MAIRRLEGDEVTVSPQVLSDMLSLVLGGTGIPAPVVATWTPREREEAAGWAAAEHLSASDNPVRRLEMPELVRRSAEICASPAMAQLVVESWAQHKERAEHGGHQDDGERAAQDAITGLLVLFEGRPPAGERPVWQDAAVGIMWRHPEGMTGADLAAMLGSSCPPREDLDAWLLDGERSGLLARPSKQTWKLAWTLKGTRRQ